jgi:predicted RNA-binding protein (virulence factor B family)
LLVPALATLLAVAACQTDSRQQVLAMSDSQIALRSIQSRAFDTADQNQTMRAVIATLQDLGFLVLRTDATLGTVTASKSDRHFYHVTMTVSVRPRNERQMLVRANAQYNQRAIEEPEAYQQFFAALERSLFLVGQKVE